MTASPAHGTTVVTGAAGGIGRAIVTRLLGSGRHVVALDRSAEALAALTADLPSDRLSSRVCDVTSEDDVRSIAADLTTGDVPVTGLVNNAAIMRGGVGLEDLDVATWRETLDVNLTGTFLCMREIGRAMLDRGGAIVNISSAAGLVAGPFRGSYSASKAAVVMVSRQAAVEWGPRQVRVNVVCPGLVVTPMSEHQYADPGHAEARIRRVPLRRVAEVDEVADAVAFLLSPESAYVNGATLQVDGGLAVAGLAGVNA